MGTCRTDCAGFAIMDHGGPLRQSRQLEGQW